MKIIAAPTILKTPYMAPPSCQGGKSKVRRQVSAMSVCTADTASSKSTSPWSATPAILKDTQGNKARKVINKKKSLAGLDRKTKKNAFAVPMDLLLARNTVLPSL